MAFQLPNAFFGGGGEEREASQFLMYVQSLANILDRFWEDGISLHKVEYAYEEHC